MSKEGLKEQIGKDFPVLFRRNRGFEFSEGWARLVYDLAAAISMEAQKEGIAQDSEDYPSAVQTKEKFGFLRFYVHGATPTMRRLIERAEKKSAKICERCGLAGEMRRDSAWHHVACNQCEAKIESERKAYSLGD